MSRSTAMIEAAVDKAIAIPASRITERVARMRRDRPGADTAELVALAADRFRNEAGLSSGAAGASAAPPARRPSPWARRPSSSAPPSPMC